MHFVPELEEICCGIDFRIIIFCLKKLRGTSKNLFEKQKRVEWVGFKESRRRKAVCFARRFDAAKVVLRTFLIKQDF
ncbi:MAG TPA: hypothetical protein DDX91_09740 [Ruminococcaceae bacterium]|nr:hypothetical protein [Oscillospiraceae bacterium]